VEKYPHIEGFGDNDNWSVTDAERYRDDLVRRRILDVASPLDHDCPACGLVGWRMNIFPECARCGFGSTLGQEESATEVRKRAFLHRLLILEPLRRDPFSELNAQGFGHAAEVTDRRLEAIATIGLAYKNSRQLLSELGVRENIQASHMLCVALGAIAMNNLGVDDPEWLIDEVAGRLSDDDYARFVKQSDVRSGLHSLYRDVCHLTTTGDLGGTCHLCQVAFIHHFADYTEASRHQEKIVKGVAGMVAHATVASSLKASLLSGSVPPIASQRKGSGCMVLLLCGVVVARAVNALIGMI
jgi:hypothetical protein